jgi:hypothetical protein
MRWPCRRVKRLINSKLCLDGTAKPLGAMSKGRGKIIALHVQHPGPGKCVPDQWKGMRLFLQLFKNIADTRHGSQLAQRPLFGIGPDIFGMSNQRGAQACSYMALGRILGGD